MRGTVVMKDENQEAHVCLGDNEVKPGDRVGLYKNVCLPPKEAAKLSDPTFGGCKMVKLGDGRVVQSLNEHYSIVKVDPGVDFKEGSWVQKE